MPINNQELIKKLGKMEKEFDSEVNMLEIPHSTAYHYHSNLRGGYVHPTRDSLEYAVELLDSGNEDYRKRAVEILKAVILMQDNDPHSDTYGIWPHFYEEPLGEMTHPDSNWADFCGKALLQVALDHLDRIPEDIKNMVKESTTHAARSIIRRNVGPDYTNIAIMGTYVTLLSGELFGEEEIFDYGKKKLERFYDFTMYHGAFNEYNSPTYTVVALRDLNRMLHHIEDKECLERIGDLYHLAWKTVAQHFHPTTCLWTGPHSRSYNSLDTRFWPLIQAGTDGKIKLLPEEEVREANCKQRVPLKCPDELLEYFQSLESERYFREIFHKGEGESSEIATSYLRPEFALGTFYRSTLWNQRRPVIAYWGCKEKPVYLQLRCLHDNYDYSSAVVHSVQSKGSVLSTINFAIDGGDKHICLDMVENATIKAEDLRLRLEFGGSIKDIKPDNNWGKDDTLEIHSDGVNLQINVPYCVFDNNEIQYEVKIEKDKKRGDKLCFDIVLYQGIEKEIDFSRIKEAVCLLAISINSDDSGNIPAINIERVKDRLKAVWKLEGKQIEFTGEVKPDELNQLYDISRGNINSGTDEL